jgi:8-oxo-dGTP pyrophosphatase MutT (NUDIX family)
MGEEKEEKTKPKLSREFSSGGVVYKIQKNLNSEILFLVSKSKPSPEYPKDNWRFPKGWIDDGIGIPGPKASGKVKATEEDLEKTAVREVMEEGEAL